MTKRSAKASEDIVVIWKMPRAKPEVAAKVMSQLASVMTGVSPPQFMDKALAAAQTKNPVVAMEIFKQITDVIVQSPHDANPFWRNMALSWMWTAACLDHIGGIIGIAQELARAAFYPDQKETAKYLRDLSVQWLSLAPDLHEPHGEYVADIDDRSPIEMSGLGEPSSYIAAARAKIAEEGWGSDVATDDVVDEEPVEQFVIRQSTQPQRDSVVVVSEIGQPHTPEGQAITKTYDPIIGRRVHFAGRIPRAQAVASEILASWPWAESVAHAVEGNLSLYRRMNISRLTLPRLLLLGPSGTGKTTLAERLCQMLELPYETIPCAGVGDLAGLTATTRGWQGTKAAAPVRLMTAKNCANPALILDELDKSTGYNNQNGSVHGALLTMLGGTERYYDGCLMAGVDINHVSFLATANDALRLPEELRLRFMIHVVPRPGAQHFEHCLNQVRLVTARKLRVRPEFLPSVTGGHVEWLRQVFLKAQGNLHGLERAYQLLTGELAQQEEELAQVLH